MRILHLNWSFTVGGAECRLLEQFRNFSSDIESHLMIVNKHCDIDLLNKLPGKVATHLIGRPISSKNPFYYAKINYLIKRIDPEIIVFHVANLVELLFGKRKYAKILHLHNVHEAIGRYVEKYDGYIAISEAVAEHIKNYSRMANPQVIYNGISLSSFKERTKFDLGDCFKIIQIGRLNDQVKGQSFFLNVMHKISSNNCIGKWSLDFVGDGPSRSYLEKLSYDLGLEKKVHFHGQMPSEFLYDNLKNYNLLVLPSFSEGLGNAVIEGMAAKVPVLVSNLPGPMEVIKEGAYGKFFEPGNIEDCIEKIVEIYLDYGSGKFVNSIQASHEYAQEMFDISSMARKVERFFIENIDKWKVSH